MHGHGLHIAAATPPEGTGLRRKLSFPFWIARNGFTMARAFWQADAVHAPIPGDVGTIGMVLAVLFRKPLFVRHCGNWLNPRTPAEHFWQWFMEKYAGGRNVMLCTGGTGLPPSSINANIRWIFSTSMSQRELEAGEPRRAPVPGQPVRLIIVCRQEEAKNTAAVIASLPTLAQQFPGLVLDVVGDGGHLPVLRAQSVALGVGDRVIFHGKQDHEAVLRLLTAAHLFVYPTRASEGFPKVVLEALACGLPVITTRVSVLPQLIGHGGGVLLDASTAEAVTEAVAAALTDHGKYEVMSRSAITTAAQFSLERWRDTIATALRSAWQRPLGAQPDSRQPARV